jgi:hypothetical protein
MCIKIPHSDLSKCQKCPITKADELVQKKRPSGEGILVCHVSEKRLGGGGGGKEKIKDIRIR